MQYEKITLYKLTIVGISVRTINQNNQALRDIGELWGKFMLNNIQQSIPNRVSDDIYCVYTDYESDYTGEYTTLLGCVVSSVNNIPDDFVIKEIPACNYHKYISEGKIPESVGKTWGHIWASDTDRKYLADFDVYGKESQDPDHAIVTTYLSIK